MIRRVRFVAWGLPWMLAACAAPQPRAIDYEHPDQQIMAVNLASNYLNHPNVADRDHTRKVLEVSGRVLRMEPGHVVLGSVEKGEVWCAFEGGAIPGQIPADQTITVIGVCRGKNGHVLVDLCRLKP